jgi:hypothetical protein
MADDERRDPRIQAALLYLFCVGFTCAAIHWLRTTP